MTTNTPQGGSSPTGPADAVGAAGDDASFAIDVARVAHDSKADDIVVLDLRGISPVCDYFVICTGTSDRQMRAVADEIEEYAARLGRTPFGRAGQQQATWILIDFVTVVIHVFDEEHRRHYDLELLWGDVPRVDWQRSQPPSTGTDSA
jgi:ribosome-associated protein